MNIKPVKFNPNLRLLPTAAAWLDSLRTAVLGIEKRTRARRAGEATAFDLALEVLAANLLQLNCVAADWPLEVRKDRNASQQHAAYGMHHISIVDAFTRLGWITDHRTRRTYIKKGYRSLSTVTLDRMPFSTCTLADIWIVRSTSPVVLKSAKDANGHADRLPLPATQDCADLVQQTLAVNEYLNSLQTEFLPHGYPTRHWLQHGDGLVSYIKAIADNSVTRIFNESFSQGGRLFHGWWLNIEHDLRFAQIRLKGERIAYVDYNALYLRLAYAYIGMQYPVGDAYTAGSGPRAVWKRLTLAMLMARSRMSRYPGTQQEQKEYRQALGPSAQAACLEIEVHHPELQGLWYTGIGARFQCIESDLIIAALLRCQANGLTALPVHDCCICPASEATRVASIMESTACAVRLQLPAGIETAKQ